MENDAMDYFAKLNRLRVNVGKPELKSWKASKDKLLDAIDVLTKAGAVDVLPGANLDAKPLTTDPKVLEALAKADEPKEEKPPVEEKVTKVKPGLGRGLGDEKYAVHSRAAVQQHRRDERKGVDRKIKLTEQELQAIREEASARPKPKGQVDEKKEPEKAARQKKHIEEKKAKREKEGKVSTKKEVSSDEVTVADIARKLGIDPKVARAKLRRHEDKLEKLHTKGQDRWTFPQSAAKQIKDILSGAGK